MSECTEKPVITLRDDDLEVLIYEHQSPSGAFHTVEFKRKCRDADKLAFVEDRFLRPDLLKLAYLANQAYEMVGKRPTSIAAE